MSGAEAAEHMPSRPVRRASRTLFPLSASGVLLALLGVWSWYASRPKLAWYVSPEIHGKRVRLLIPAGWGQEQDLHGAGSGRVDINLIPPDTASRWPNWLSWLRPRTEEASIRLTLDPDFQFLGLSNGQFWFDALPAERRSRAHLYDERPEQVDESGNLQVAAREVATRDGRHAVLMIYRRQSRAAFDATHEVICNSLRIE